MSAGYQAVLWMAEFLGKQTGCTASDAVAQLLAASSMYDYEALAAQQACGWYRLASCKFV
jgi:hypothetical protein